ncbi:hypothetical protein BX070DRAFT_227925 [Coemansia spiralis]|nr:hypothetical protein BX070DRAFT_227925 [Coemansia spiralis]
MTNIEGSASAVCRVWNNSLIVGGLVGFMDKSSLLQICLTCKQGWLYAIALLWSTPDITTMRNFRSFAATVGKPLPHSVGEHAHYGELVRIFDLFMLAGRWERLGYDDVAPVFKHCTRLRKIGMNLCQHISDISFVKLFTENPHLSSITALDLSELMLEDQAIYEIIGRLPNLHRLELNETNAGYLTCCAIVDSLPNIRWLDLSDCNLMDDNCVRMLLNGCKHLTHLSVEGCFHVVDELNIAGLAVDEWTDEYDASSGYSSAEDGSPFVFFTDPL